MLTHIVSGWCLVDTYAYTASPENSYFRGLQHLVELKAECMDSEGYEDVADAAEQLFRDEFGALPTYMGAVFNVVAVPDDVSGGEYYFPTKFNP